MKITFATILLPLAVLISAAVVSSCDKKNTEEPDPGTDSSTAAVAISDVTTTTESVSFTLTPQNAEKLAWQILEPGAQVPTAEDIITLGTQADATSPSTVVQDGLEASVTYTIAAAAWNENGYSAVVTEEAVTSDQPEVDKPTVSIESLRIGRTALDFTFTQTGAEKVYYSVVTEINGAPRADQIVAEGNEADIAAGIMTVDGLSESTNYILAVTAVAGDLTAEVDWETFSTLYTFEIDEDMENIVFTTVEASLSSQNEGDDAHLITADFAAENGLSLSVKFYAELTEDKSIPDGTYTVSKEHTPNSIVPGEVYSADISRNSGSFLNMNGSEYGAIDSGTMIIDGGRITFDFGFNMYYNFTGSFDGEISVELVSAIGSDLTGDYVANFSSGQPVTFTVYNWTDHEDVGFIRYYVDDKGADQLYVEIIWTDPDPDNIPLGTFDVATECIHGFGTVSNLVEGTGLCIREEGFQYGMRGYSAAPAVSGSVTIQENEDGTFTLSFDMFDDVGHNISGSYIGNMDYMWF